MQPCLNLHATAQPLNGLFDDGQAQTSTWSVLRSAAYEAVENSRTFCFGYAGAVVCHGERDVIGLILQGNGKLPALTTVTQRVVEQIHYD